MRPVLLVSCLVVVLGSAPAIAQEVSPTKEGLEAAYGKQPYSPYAGRDFPERPLWGDTHVHTEYSFDAGSFGARLDPNDAYRFARGEEVISSTGQPVRLARALDFLVVSDHSDNMGFFPRLVAGDAELLEDPTGRRWYDDIQKGGQDAVAVALEAIDLFSRGKFPPALESRPGDNAYRSAWDDTIRAADSANAPGAFTAFIGYEWTSNTGGNNLHRVVIYRDDATRAGLLEPFTTFPPEGSDKPEDLWKWLRRYEERTGGQVLAIPHNGNLSNGIMFPALESILALRNRKAHAEERIRWEPLVEVTQIKGDGEAHPFLSPDDEFADYETWDKGNLNLSVPKKNSMLQYEYARPALQLGLQIEKSLGVNPYKFGMIGATDSHTALATADEDNFFGKHSGSEPSAGRVDHPMARFGDVVIEGWAQVAAGYAGVWAHENTRAAIFDAMKRKEVYATTGPRMVVRFFGGWEFTEADGEARWPAEVGYRKGVPMGGNLRKAGGRTPTFLVGALKDPIGANLDRVQIIKGWIERGKPREKVYDVALSDGRQAGPDGKVPAVGNTVDVANVTWTNSIGAAELVTVWKDPDFDPEQHAFYYARVIEIPTPRWTAYDAKHFGLKPGPEVPMTTQERAYTSPIWYTP
jgi:hypothetical protein